MTGAPLRRSTPLMIAVGPFERDVGAHALELGDVHEALREDGFGDDADAVALAKQRAHLRLHVGGKAGIRLGGESAADFGVPLPVMVTSLALAVIE